MATWTINPGDNVIAVVAGGSAGDTYNFAAGVHRITQGIVPRSGDTYAGAAGGTSSFLLGSKVLPSTVGATPATQWQTSGSLWYVTGQTQQGYNGYSALDFVGNVGRGAGYPEDLFYAIPTDPFWTLKFHNATAYTNVAGEITSQRTAQLAALVAGQWWFDYHADRIYTADDPTGKTIETSVAVEAFSGTTGATGVTIRDLIIDKFASYPQHAMIDGDNASNWTIYNCEIARGHAHGVEVHDGMTLRECNIHHQGQLGVGGGGSGMMVRDNTVSYSNTVGYQVGWEAGGCKFAFCGDLTVQGNYIHHNDGIGLWTDLNCYNVIFDGNIVDDNNWLGIFHEISQNAIIRNNVVRHNCKNFNVAVWEVIKAGIAVAASHDVEIYGNYVEDDSSGLQGWPISVFQQDRRSVDDLQPVAPNPYAGNNGGNDHICYNISIHDNYIASPVNSRVAVSADTLASNPNMFTSGTITFANNHYYIGDGTYSAWSYGNGGTQLTYTQWNALSTVEEASNAAYNTYTLWSHIPPNQTSFVTDDFNRANSSGLGASWTGTVNDFDIASNRAISTVADANNFVAFTDPIWLGGANQYSKCKIQNVGAFDGGPGVRLSASEGSGYFVSIGLLDAPSTHSIGRTINQVYQSIAQFNATIATGDLIQIDILGSLIRVRQAGVIIGQVTDTQIATGFPGIHAYSDGFIAEDWAGGIFGLVPGIVNKQLNSRRRRA